MFCPKRSKAKSATASRLWIWRSSPSLWKSRRARRKWCRFPSCAIIFRPNSKPIFEHKTCAFPDAANWASNCGWCRNTKRASIADKHRRCRKSRRRGGCLRRLSPLFATASRATRTGALSIAIRCAYSVIFCAATARFRSPNPKANTTPRIGLGGAIRGARAAIWTTTAVCAPPPSVAASTSAKNRRWISNGSGAKTAGAAR